MFNKIAIPALMLALLIWAMLLQTSASAYAQTIYFASGADHAPYSSLDRTGRVQGFEAELQDLLCARANLTCAWVLAPHEELIQQLQYQEFDVIMSAFQITEDRKNYIVFSDAYLADMPSAVLVLSGDSLPSKGEMVAAVDGSLQGQLATSQGWVLTTFERASGALAALEAGDIGAVIADQAYVENLIAHHPDQYDMAASGMATPGGIGLGLRVSDSGLLARLNLAIGSLEADGTLGALRAKWMRL